MKITRKRVAYFRQYKGQTDDEACRIEFRLPTPKEWLDWQAMLVAVDSIQADAETDARTLASIAVDLGTSLILSVSQLEVDGEFVEDPKIVAELFPYQIAALAQNMIERGGGASLDLGESEGRPGSSQPTASVPSKEDTRTSPSDAES